MPVSFIQHRQAIGAFDACQAVHPIRHKLTSDVSTKLPPRLHTDGDNLDKQSAFDELLVVLSSIASKCLHDTTLLCVKLVILLLVLTFAELVVYIYVPIRNVHNEIPATFIQLRQTTAVYEEDFNYYISEVDSFLQYGGASNGLVKMLLLLLAGDVEFNPGPDYPACECWKQNAKKEINSPDMTAAVLRGYVYVQEKTGLKTINMKYWKRLPESLCELIDLEYLIIDNSGGVQLEQLPRSITKLHRIVRLEIIGNSLYRNRYKLFPSTWMQTIRQLVSLQQLYIENYDLSQCADGVGSISDLHELTMRNANLSILPRGVSKLNNLQTLNLSNNQMTSLPEVISALKNLQILDLSMNKLFSLPESISTLNNLQTLHLSQNKLNEIPTSVLRLKQLQELDLSMNNIQLLPPSIRSLQCLKKLNLCGTPVTHLPVELSELPQLEEIKVIARYSWQGKPCPLVQPPIELCQQGTEATLRYLHDLRMFAPVRTPRQKVVLSGDTGGGKTSLCRTLCSEVPQLAASEERTKVLEQTTWQPKPDIMLQINDFGGHSIYKVTQPFFISPKIIHLHVFNLKEYVIGSKKSFDDLIGHWLANAYERIVKVNISVIGTHSDKVSDCEIVKRDVTMRLNEMSKIRNEEIRRCVLNIEAKQKSGNKTFLTDLIQSRLKVLREELNHCLQIPRFFIVSSKTYNGIASLRQHIIDIAEQSQVNLPESWHNFILDVADPKWKTGQNVFLTWSTIEEIYASKFNESLAEKVRSFFSKFSQRLIRLKNNKLTLILCYMRDAGEVLFFPESCLANVVFHDINILTETMKSIFIHDLHKELQYRNFNKEFSKPTFNQMKQDVFNTGMFHVDLLLCLWKKHNIKEDCFDTLLDLLKLFDLCYEVPSNDSRNKHLLFPWYMQNSKLEEVDTLWSINHQYQLTIEFHFWPEVPLNFFEMSLVKFLRDCGTHFSRTFVWKNGACSQQDSVRNLLEKVKDSETSRPMLRLAVRGDDLNDLWERLFPIFRALKRKLDGDWPGALYEVFQVCPHCVSSGIEPATLFPGELLDEDAEEKNIPCNNADAGRGMINSRLICPPREMRLRYQHGSHEHQVIPPSQPDEPLIPIRQDNLSVEQQKTKDELHYELILNIQEDLTSEDFQKVKHLAKALLSRRSWEKINEFSDLVDELAKKGVLVSWTNGGYSKLIDFFNTAGLPQLVRLIKEYEEKIKKSPEVSSSNR